MKSIATLGIALAFAAGTGLALADSTQAPLTRAEVKAETRALEKTHKLTPAGQGVKPYDQPARASTKTIADRKAETLAARKAGELEPAGDVGDIKAERAAMSTPSATTRAARKADTRAAEKNRMLVPAGEGPDAPKK